MAPPPELTADLEREYRAVVEEILELRGDDGRISAFVRSITEPGALADTAGYSPDLNNEQKLELLETLDIVERLSLALQLQQERLAELQRAQAHPRGRRESGAQKQQRDYFLRQQMDAIRKELGENEASVAEDYRKKIADAGMPEPSSSRPSASCRASSGMGDQNAEVVDDPHVSRLAAGGAVVEAVRGAARPGARARSARRRPRRPRRREGSASPSTWRCASCARIAAWPTTGARARS